jgi:8-oxo-dGTP diphosphatase
MDEDVLGPPTEAPTAIAAVLRREDGRFLLIRRAEGVPKAGYWTPITGRVEPGETLQETVVREVREEVGLEVRAGPIVHRSTTDDGKWNLVWFEGIVPDPSTLERPLSLARSEVAEARWLDLDEIARLEPMFSTTREFFGSRWSRPTGTITRRERSPR